MEPFDRASDVITGRPMDGVRPGNRRNRPRMLFSGPHPDNTGWTRPRSHDVTEDGERFLLTKLPGEQPRPRIMVVLHWFDELRAKVPR
jgi:hypothetical protein